MVRRGEIFGIIIRGMEVGTDYIGVGTSLVCHDGQGHVFLNKRSRNCRDEWGKWDHCGGKLEFGESPEQCVERELREEYGCEPLNCRFGGIVNTIRAIKGRKTHWVILVYLVQIDPQKAHNNEPEKFEEVGWFELSQLPAERHTFYNEDVKTIASAWKDFYGWEIDLESLCSSTERTAAS